MPRRPPDDTASLDGHGVISAVDHDFGAGDKATGVRTGEQ